MSAFLPGGKMPPSTAPIVYQMKVVLAGIAPPIWRRFQVLSDITFYELHRVLQIVMGWGNYHLYRFAVADTELSDPVTAAELEMKNAEQTTLIQLLHEETLRFAYEYDFGARWEHELLVEERVPLEGARPFPICLAGENACPPEGSGGSRGYTQFLASLQERTRPIRLTDQGWVRPPYEHTLFDIDKVNAALAALQYE